MQCSFGSGRRPVEFARVEPRSPSESASILTRWMGVTDANTAGNVHGGVILRLCDEAAGLAAVRHSRGRVVTAGMDRMTFLSPVYIGQLVTCSAMVNAAWRTSGEGWVRVEPGDVRTGGGPHACTAYLTLVAPDRDGQPTRVPPLIPETPDEV